MIRERSLAAGRALTTRLCILEAKADSPAAPTAASSVQPETRVNAPPKK
jgi:hypothetical protein